MEDQPLQVSCSSKFGIIHVLFVCLMISSSSMVASANFFKDIDHTWGDDRVQILNNGEVITVTLDETSGSGFRSRDEYLFAKIDLQIKLVPGNSAGTVTAFYVSVIEDFSSVLVCDEIKEAYENWGFCFGIIVVFYRAIP